MVVLWNDRISCIIRFSELLGGKASIWARMMIYIGVCEQETNGEPMVTNMGIE
jgi:hypothetical protein